MTSAEPAADRQPSGGGGRLAQVLATRGGKAAPEAPFVIEHREALIYMLCEAAELEHGIMCQYLFAAFSLKQSADEGLTDDEAAAANRWRGQVLHVAAQEMLHLALVQNLLTAIGGPPHLVRPNLPQPAAHYPAGVQLALLPFGERALRHFMYLERPEGMDLDDAEGIAAVGRAEPLMSEGDIVPRPQDFATVGHLYRSIEAGFAHLAERHGEEWLFVGQPRAQAAAEHFGWTDLVTVTDLASAQRAIDTILEQGEGPRGDWRNAHFGQFVRILDEYLGRRDARPGFDPVRPVIAANVRPPQRDVDVPLITDPLTARVADLFNVGQEILLQIFARYFAHTEETDEQLKVLADATIRLMAGVLQPLADVITTLPAGPGHEGKNAGPSFELFYEADYLLPHREAAWTLLTERLATAASFCRSVGGDCGPAVAGRLAPVMSALQETAQSLGAHLPAGRSHAMPDEPDPQAVATQLARASELAGKARDAAGEHGHAAGEHGHAAGEHGHAAGEHGHAAGEHGQELAAGLADLAEATGRAAAAGGSRRSGGDLVWDAAKAATRLRVRAGQAGLSAPELAEATAVLQDLACQLAPAPERAGRRAELWRLQDGLAAGIQAARNGPYLVTNARLRDHLGTDIPAPPATALCRCGGSATKPFCDGSHASNGFTDAKDPKRVPDRLDSYPGVAVTVLDNRGTCQHSGLCTDRLPNVFRAGQEPFVAPSGARADDIVSAVRNCPSGALSFAVDAQAARGQTDWGGTREPAIEVSLDGPYRITGGIALTGADGTDAARNQGASREHFAICRCGHSQNKPFCSGMHWYVGFRDPLPDPGREPTLFEWAGGRPALTRMTRLFFAKYVPGDPVLAPTFAQMPAGLPDSMAAWLGEVFGGPASRSGGPAGYPGLIAELLPKGLNEEQRGRWATLLGAAAREAGLPADPQFRAAFAAYAEWEARVSPPAPSPVPRWDWGPAGPPSARAAEPADGADQDPVTLPGAGQPVSFAAHIKPLFRERDRQSMSFAFDLWSYDDVKVHAAGILERLRDGSMPCDGAWPAVRVETFARWTATQMLP
jgi:CDGSH-type Zn-finger protein/truncated hemoglobin YjbI/ferredoxin